jgi:hypothetical protein
MQFLVNSKYEQNSYGNLKRQWWTAAVYHHVFSVICLAIVVTFCGFAYPAGRPNLDGVNYSEEWQAIQIHVRSEVLRGSILKFIDFANFFYENSVITAFLLLAII